MPEPRPLPDDLRGIPFSVGAARDLGVTPRRLRALDLHAPFHGVRSPVPAGSELPDVCRAYLPRMSADQFFSHVTAARLYGMPLPSALVRRPGLDVSAPAIQPRAAGIVGHRATARIRSVRGLPVADPVAVFAQLAPVIHHRDLVVAGDYLVRRKRPLVTLDELTAAVGDAAGRRGVRRLRTALAEVRPGTDSPMETLLRLVLTAAGLPEPAIGFTIVDDTGGFIGTPDLCYPAERIAIEYEGDHHRANREVFAEDIERRELMQESDWYVIRVISDHVLRQPAWLIQRVKRVLVQRGRLL